tara:strand:- start:2186 stop:2344 length:159 start_codon:yes stop_codon:yes gene_type:complete
MLMWEPLVIHPSLRGVLDMAGFAIAVVSSVAAGLPRHGGTRLANSAVAALLA